MDSVEPRTLELDESAVHVWAASLEVQVAGLRALGRHLSDDETKRALRLRTHRERALFIAARGILRELVGRYLGIEPRAVRFLYGPRGKPRIGESSLAINVSHAGGRAVFAFARGREIGVDIERVRRAFPCERIAEDFFSSAEVASLRALAPHERSAAFFRCWTRKEAYLKARGDGLAVDLRSFDVSLDEPASLLREEYEPGRFALYDLDPPPAHAAALAVEGSRPRVCQWLWPRAGTP